MGKHGMKEKLKEELRKEAAYNTCGWDMNGSARSSENDPDRFEKLQFVEENKPLFLIPQKYSVSDIINYYQRYNHKISKNSSFGRIILKAIDRKDIIYHFTSADISNTLSQEILKVINDKNNIVPFVKEKTFYKNHPKIY